MGIVDYAKTNGFRTWEMQNRRNSEVVFSAIEEDIGLFKSDVVDVRIDVSPMRRTTSRGDLLCVGFLKDVEIEVVFPGRRRRDTGPMEAHLSYARKLVTA